MTWLPPESHKPTPLGQRTARQFLSRNLYPDVIMLRFEGVYPISNEDLCALPVGDIARAVDYYTRVLGFEQVARDAKSATLRRDAAQIGLVLDPQHDPGTAGSCYFEVSDVDALRQELVAKGAKPGDIHVQQHGGKNYRLFFARECDSMHPHDGYCFCFGRKLEQAEL